MTFRTEDYQGLATQRVRCTCCGSTRHIPTVTGDRYGFGLSTVTCGTCGLVFTNPRPGDAWFGEFYRLHYRQFYESVETPDARYLGRDWIVGRHRRNLELLAGFLAPTGRLLDVGCAEGTFLHLFEQRFPGWDVQGIEPSERFSSFARTHYGLRSVRTGELADVTRYLGAERFDLITLGHVLEHVLDPNPLFETVRNLLNAEGLLFIDVPDAEGKRPGIWNLHIAHVCHYSRRTLGHFLEKYGFEPLVVQSGLERPDPWTIQSIARKLRNMPPDWSPAPLDAERIARAFARHSRIGFRDRLVSVARWSRRKIDRLRRLGGHQTSAG